MMTEACTYIIFGATGNLSRIKLMPALYHLELENLIPAGSRILAIGRRDWDRETWLAEVRDMVNEKARGGLKKMYLRVFQNVCIIIGVIF
jgi:glucose-6-phosphate 1-dehydrogenase